MAFSRITQVDLNRDGATTLPNQPTCSADELKRHFDAPAKEIVAPAVNRLITELEDVTAASNIGAITPSTSASSTVQAELNSVSSGLSALEAATEPAILDAHTHDNKDVIDKFSEDQNTGKPLYDGDVIGETNYNNLDNRPQINGHTLSGNMSTTDIGISIPDELSDLISDADHRTVSDTEKATWNGKSTVVWNQLTTTGQKIATITLNGTPTDVFAPTGGGGGGGGAVDSVNSQTGDVHLDLGDMEDVTLTSLTENDGIIRNSSNQWVNFSIPAVARTGSYNDLNNLPTIPTVTDTYSSLSHDAMSGVALASALELDNLSDVTITSPQADQVLKHNGTGWVNGSAPTSGHEMIPATADDTDVDTIANMTYADASQNKVVNAYTIQKYSNVECMTLFTRASQGTDTIGSWNDTWETDGDRQNWLWHSALYNILKDDEVEASMVFDVQTNETVSVYAYRVDDEVFQPVTSPSGNPKAQGWYESDGQTPPTYTETNDTTVQAGKTYYMGGGAIAIKLNSKIQNPSGVKIGLNLKRQRTLVDNFSVIS